MTLLASETNDLLSSLSPPTCPGYPPAKGSMVSQDSMLTFMAHTFWCSHTHILVCSLSPAWEAGRTPVRGGG